MTGMRESEVALAKSRPHSSYTMLTSVGATETIRFIFGATTSSYFSISPAPLDAALRDD